MTRSDYIKLGYYPFVTIWHMLATKLTGVDGANVVGVIDPYARHAVDVPHAQTMDERNGREDGWVKGWGSSLLHSLLPVRKIALFLPLEYGMNKEQAGVLRLRAGGYPPAATGAYPPHGHCGYAPVVTPRTGLSTVTWGWDHTIPGTTSTAAASTEAGSTRAAACSAASTAGSGSEQVGLHTSCAPQPGRQLLCISSLTYVSRSINGHAPCHVYLNKELGTPAHVRCVIALLAVP